VTDYTDLIVVYGPNIDEVKVSEGQGYSRIKIPADASKEQVGRLVWHAAQAVLRYRAFERGEA